MRIYKIASLSVVIILITVLFAGAVTVSAAAQLPNPPYPTVTDLLVRQAPSMPEPPARLPYIDPVFGTRVMRVTNHKTDLSADDTSPGLKNEYSRVQSFNADETKLIARSINARWYLYNATTLKPLGEIPIGGMDPRWDAANPNVLYYSDGTSLMSYNIATKQKSLVHDFARDYPGQNPIAVWMRYEGSPSIDGRYWGLMAEDQNWAAFSLLIYDKVTDHVIAKRDITGTGDVDWVSISPRGDYFLAGFLAECSNPSRRGTDAHPCGLMVYDRNLTHGRGLGDYAGHGDAALDAQGREVFVYQDSATDHLSKVDLATGTNTPLWPIDFSHTSISFHISGRAFNRPGWALISTTDSSTTSYTWMDDQVFAIELKANGRVVRLAHDRTLVDPSQERDYWAEPHGSVNRDFTKVLFTSNWGKSGTGEVEMYMVTLPSDWTSPPFIVNAIDPAINAHSVPTNKTVSVTFTKPIQPGANYANVTLRPTSNNVKVSATTTLSGNRLMIRPSSTLAYNTGYTVFIPKNGVKYGTQTIMSDFTSHFTTVAAPKKLTTTLNATASTTTPTVKQNFTIKGGLTASGAGLGYKTITLQRSLDNKTFTTSTTRQTNGTGWYQFSRSEMTSGTCYYRTKYAGDSTYTNATSKVVKVTVTKKPTTFSISTSPTAPKLNVAFTVSGTLKSGTSGLKGLSVHLERKIVGGSWTTVASATKTTGTGGVVSVSQKVTSHNTYSYRWHFIGTATYLPCYSPVKTFTV